LVQRELGAVAFGDLLEAEDWVHLLLKRGITPWTRSPELSSIGWGTKSCGVLKRRSPRPKQAEGFGRPRDGS
jgi:hypothetical protein